MRIKPLGINSFNRIVGSIKATIAGNHAFGLIFCGKFLGEEIAFVRIVKAVQVTVKHEILHSLIVLHLSLYKRKILFGNLRGVKLVSCSPEMSDVRTRHKRSVSAGRMVGAYGNMAGHKRQRIA